MGAAFHRVERYASIWSDGMRFSLRDDGTRRFVAYAHSSPATDVGTRAAIECVLAEVVGIAREITRDEIPGLQVCFEHPSPLAIGAHEAHFGRGHVTFGARATGIAIDSKWFDRPMPTRDVAMGHYFEQQATSWLETMASTSSLVHDVGRRIAAALPSGDATLVSISRRLATSPRTLRRRLAENDTTFERIVADTRRDLAIVYLQRPDVSLAEIALLLGFSDQTAFQRAFRRWTGETPRSMRLRMPAVPATPTRFGHGRRTVS